MKDKKIINIGKKVLSGVVVSNKTEKTVIVAVTNTSRHPLYKKAVKKTRRYEVHNDKEELEIGNKVKIVETRPISKTKHFKILEKISH